MRKSYLKTARLIINIVILAAMVIRLVLQAITYDPLDLMQSLPLDALLLIDALIFLIPMAVINILLALVIKFTKKP